MSLQIAPEAVAYIKKHLIEGRAEEFVVAIVALMDVPSGAESLEETMRKGRRFVQTLPRDISLQWTVGNVERRRVPAEYCRVVNGIPVFIPPEQEYFLKDRSE